MNIPYKLLFFFTSILWLFTACTEEELNGPSPIITWDQPSARYTIYAGETLTIVPYIENIDEITTYSWTINDHIVGSGASYSFYTKESGTYYIGLTVTNRYGSAEDEAKITVKKSEGNETNTLPIVPVNDSVFSWRFPWAEQNIALGRSIKVKAYCIENADSARFRWQLDGAEVEGLNDEVAYVFQAQTIGTHTLVLTMENGDTQESKTFTLNVCAQEGTYQRMQSGESLVNRVYEYMPAPGHQVNGYIIVGESFPSACTHEQACDTVLAHFQRSWMISLGGQGGYVIAGFDHSISNKGGQEIIIKGNPYSYQNEPGIIWVSQDDNGDGLPNDQWFELAGSEYNTENEIKEYAITYYRPTVAHSYTAWRDSEGNSDYIPYMDKWNPTDTYWQPWISGSEHTFFGSRLVSHHTYENISSNMPPYAWGYADNDGSDYNNQEGVYSISNARTWDGKEANLRYIDFIKIQTAQYGWTPNLGEISTEVYYIKSNE